MASVNYLDYLPLALGVLGSLAALYYKNRATKAETIAITSEVHAKDAELVVEQNQVEEKKKEVDKGIQNMLAEREKLRNKYVNDQQRADSWNKKDDKS